MRNQYSETVDFRHYKFRNQANSFENFDFLKDFQKKSNKKLKYLIKIGVTQEKKDLNV